MDEEISDQEIRLALIAQVAGLELIPSNVHHLESLAAMKVFGLVLAEPLAVNSATFAEFAQRFERETGRTAADPARFNSFLATEVSFFKSSFLALQGYDAASGTDVGYLLLAVFGARNFEFPPEFRRKVRMLTEALLAPSDFMARRFGFYRQQLPPPIREHVTVPGDRKWSVLATALIFNTEELFVDAPIDVSDYIQSQIFVSLTELSKLDPSKIGDMLLQKPFVTTSSGQVVIAAPRDLTTTLRYKIIAEASNHGCSDILHGALTAVALNFTRRLTLPLFDPPGADELIIDDETVHYGVRSIRTSD